MKVEDDNGLALVQEIEKKRGGKITKKTCSIYYADNNGREVENGVFVYQIGNTIWLEDFEKIPQIFGMRISNPKNYKYEKFERCFDKKDIEKVETVLKKDAKNFVGGKINVIKQVGKIKAFFGEPVTMVTLNDKSVLFLQLLDNAILK